MSRETWRRMSHLPLDKIRKMHKEEREEFLEAIEHDCELEEVEGSPIYLCGWGMSGFMNGYAVRYDKRPYKCGEGSLCMKTPLGTFVWLLGALSSGDAFLHAYIPGDQDPDKIIRKMELSLLKEDLEQEINRLMVEEGLSKEEAIREIARSDDWRMDPFYVLKKLGGSISDI